MQVLSTPKYKCFSVRKFRTQHEDSRASRVLESTYDLHRVSERGVQPLHADCTAARAGDNGERQGNPKDKCIKATNTELIADACGHHLHIHRTVASIGCVSCVCLHSPRPSIRIPQQEQRRLEVTFLLRGQLYTHHGMFVPHGFFSAACVSRT
jgi:hypothetical protein